jgi:hypothetical protein
MSSKKRTRTGALADAPIRVNESISQNVVEWRPSLWIFLLRRFVCGTVHSYQHFWKAVQTKAVVAGTVRPGTELTPMTERQLIEFLKSMERRKVVVEL